MEQESGSYLQKWKDKTPVALIYPNSYAVGMSSLGFQLVYALLNERGDLLCERFFLPEKGERPLSMESGRPLSDFSTIFISVSFEHDYINIVKILLAAEIEPFAKRRRVVKDGPLIICGGVAVFMNPEPIADFADFCIIGEAEPILNDFIDFIQEHRQRLEPLALRLATARHLEGVYAPELYTPQYDTQGRCVAIEPHTGAPSKIKRVILPTCRKAGHSELLTPLAEFSDLYLTELGRGCSRGCRFCAAGFIYRPPRLWDADAVIQGLNERDEKIKRVGLLGMEMADTVTLDHISSYIMESSCALSFSSLRADRINDKLVELLGQSQLKSVAIAPDGTSERLRLVINKGLNQTDLLSAARRLTEAGICKLKLYVMIGLPTERCEDLQEFIDLVGNIKQEIDQIGRQRGRLTEIYLSINCFVPKPWTPFQFHPFGITSKLEAGQHGTVKEALANLKSNIRFLKKGVKNLSNVHFQADKPDNALFQALLSRGDRRLGKVLYEIAALQVPWKSSLKKHEIDLEKLIISEYDEKSFFPWYVIDHGIKAEHLWHEYVKGISSSPTEPCDPTVCRRCGVCREK